MLAEVEEKAKYYATISYLFRRSPQLYKKRKVLRALMTVGFLGTMRFSVDFKKTFSKNFRVLFF